MKKQVRLLTRIVALLLVSVMALSAVACAENVPTENVKIAIEGSETPSEITKGNPVTLNVTVTGTENQEYTWTVSDATVLAVQGNVVSVIADVTETKAVTVTAISVADPSAKASKTFIVKPVVAPVSISIEGGNEYTTITKGDSIHISVTVTGAEDTSYTWSIDNPSILAQKDDSFYVCGKVDASTVVVATAIATADPTKTATKTFLVNPPPASNVTISIGDAPSKIYEGETVKLTVTVNGALEDSSYRWAISNPELLGVDKDNNVTVLKKVVLNEYVTVTAISNEDPSAKATKTFHVMRTASQGSVGELTSAMLEEIGNASITVSGSLIDCYYNNVTSTARNNEYEMTVKMEDGRWSGAWNVKGSKNVITNIYKCGETIVTDNYGNTGACMEEMYIGKDNTPISVPVKDYMSVVSVWNAQHLYNHLGDLDITKFVLDEEMGAYVYTYDEKDTDTLYLLTYLSYCLTPMLEDTLVSIYLFVENGHITGIAGQTEILYYGNEDSNDTEPTAYSYTTIDLTFSDIGTTKVADPAPFTIPEDEKKEYNLLQAALTEMQSATNYSYFTKDTSLSSPDWNSEDYSVSAVEGSAITVKSANTKIRTAAIGPTTTAPTGTVGDRGFVTENAILIGKTMKYSASMDGNDFSTSWSGYRLFDGYYEEFSWNKQAHPQTDAEGNVTGYIGAFVGTKRVNGGFGEKILPAFRVDPALFQYTGMSKGEDGKRQYLFELRSGTSIRDVALQLAPYKNAKDAATSVQSVLTIGVNEDGHLVGTSIPYSITSGTYLGYYSTSISNIGTTTIPEGTFDGYVPREVKANWSQYMCLYFYPDHTTLGHTTAESTVPADGVFKYVFGEDMFNTVLPAPSVLMETFGDNINGPFFDYKTQYDEKGEPMRDSNGVIIAKDYVSITTSSQDYDENGKVNNYDEIVAELRTNLEALGFLYDVSNSNPDRAIQQGGSRFVSFVKGDLRIVVENNFTKNFWIYFYHAEDWSNSYTK